MNSGTGNNRRRKTNLTNNKLGKAILGTHIETGETIYFPSLMEADRAGFTYQAIYRVCIGKRKTHRGYVWKYVARLEEEK